MNYFARKDLFVCLGIWLTLEIVCFAILPALQLAQPRTSLQNWFLLSLLLGIGGAMITAGSTQLDDFLHSDSSFTRNRIIRWLLVSLVSWLGLLGIGFPLFVMSLQLFSKVFSVLKS
jgi:hypothetical protein